MSNLLFYKNPVALSKESHKNTRIKARNNTRNNTRGNNFTFAGHTNSVILAGVEFTEAAKEYPIVFAKAGEGAGDNADANNADANNAVANIVPVALLGLRAEENLFITQDGNWDARYIPAFVRRYPFILAESGLAESGSAEPGQTGQRIVCIDESFPGFSESEGDPLFENGQPTALLKQAMDFLEEYQRQYVRTEAFVKRLVSNDLLKTLNAQVDLVDGKQFGLTGLMVVDEAKLLQMGDDEALAFFKSGELAWVYCHLMSLGCMSILLDRLALLTGASQGGRPGKKPVKAGKAGKKK